MFFLDFLKFSRFYICRNDIIVKTDIYDRGNNTNILDLYMRGITDTFSTVSFAVRL